MSKFKYYSTKQLVKFFIGQGKEGECWDFKQEWHDNIADLVKDGLGVAIAIGIVALICKRKEQKRNGV